MFTLAPRLDVYLRAWRYRRRVEPKEIEYVLQHVRPGQTVIDIGAHKGAYTYWLQRAVGRDGRVVAFEPQPEPAKYLEAWKKAARLAHVTIVPAAVSRRAGKMMMVREGYKASPGARLAHCEATETLETFIVPVMTLDQYCQQHAIGPVHFIKCDAEGHELQVFKGAEAILRQDRPLLLFECEERHHDGQTVGHVFDYLRSLGYEGSYFHGEQLTALAAHPHGRQWDTSDGHYVHNFLFAPSRAA